MATDPRQRMRLAAAAAAAISVKQEPETVASNSNASSVLSTTSPVPHALSEPPFPPIQPTLDTSFFAQSTVASLDTNSSLQQQHQYQQQHQPQFQHNFEQQSTSNIFMKGEDEDDEEVDMDEALPANGVVDYLNNDDGGSFDTDALKLLSPILPSPFPQHHAGPTAARFRNALQRVTSHPQTDAVAWQALLTEVQGCYRSIPNIHSSNAETAAQLDWIESCYGTLLENFPYAGDHYVTILSILLAQSARFGEPDGPLQTFGRTAVSPRAQLCERKIHYILPRLLGVDWQGKPLDDEKEGDLVKYGMLSSKVELWLLYIRKVTRDAQRTNPQSLRQVAVTAYQTATVYAGSTHNNYVLWKDYLQYIQSWMPSLPENAQLTAEQAALRQEQRSRLRQCYQSLVVHPMTGLDQLWNEYEAWERTQSEALAQALIQEFQPLYQHARTVYLERQRVYTYSQLQLDRLATLPVTNDGSDVDAQREEYECLQRWKTRCAYERTNPERLQPADLILRIRTIFREMVSVWTRHVEVWHMWSMWELVATHYKKISTAQQVLQLGLQHIPDATLLAFAQAQMIEQYTDTPQKSLEIWQNYLQQSPNTLAFVLYQQCVRRYQGKEAARAVFAKARRVLQMDSHNANSTDGVAAQDNIKVEVTNEESGQTNAETKIIDGKSKNQSTSNGKLVTHRLDPYIGTETVADPSLTKTESTKNGSELVKPAGPLTWHLYAAHATMEHRLNADPQVAAKIYELGLRKHSSFLTKAPYVQRFAQLLLELGDTTNLRALLTRAVAACQENPSNNESALAALWDMTLYFESILSGADPDGVQALHKIELQRRQALLGPEVEDVASGGFVGIGEKALIGAQKSTVAEHIIRTEGYNASSLIVNGTSRAVDVLEIMGMWGNGESDVAKARRRIKPTGNQDDEISGTKTDSELQKRLQFHTLCASGGSSDLGDSIAPKHMTARDRLQASVTTTGAVTAIQMAIQQMPEYLRAMLQLLPASKLRLPVVAKPPPHLTELALSTLRANALPAERPADDPDNAIQKRKVSSGDSSDEDDNFGQSGGYGNQFRARQKARLHGATLNGNLDH